MEHEPVKTPGAHSQKLCFRINNYWFILLSLDILYTVLHFWLFVNLIRLQSIILCLGIGSLTVFPLYGLFVCAWDFPVRISIAPEGIQLTYFGREFRRILWNQIKFLYIEDKSPLGINRFIMLSSAEITSIERFQTVKWCRFRGPYKNKKVLLVFPISRKRHQIVIDCFEKYGLTRSNGQGLRKSE